MKDDPIEKKESGHPARETGKTQRAAEQILSYMMRNRIRTGDKIPSEAELSRLFSVSRVTVREAVRGLKVLGILKSSTKGGTVVRKMDFDTLGSSLRFQLTAGGFSLTELLDTRLLIEEGNLERICGRLTPEQVETLKELSDCGIPLKNEAARRKAAEADMMFHKTLLEYGGNRILMTYSELLHFFFHYSSVSLPPETRIRNRRVSAKEHLAIVGALANGELELARGLLRHHLNRYRERIKEEPESCIFSKKPEP